MPTVMRNPDPGNGQPDVLIGMSNEDARMLNAVAARVHWDSWPMFHVLFNELSRESLNEHGDLYRILLTQAARIDRYGVFGRRTWENNEL